MKKGMSTERPSSVVREILPLMIRGFPFEDEVAGPEAGPATWLVSSRREAARPARPSRILAGLRPAWSAGEEELGEGGVIEMGGCWRSLAATSRAIPARTPVAGSVVAGGRDAECLEARVAGELVAEVGPEVRGWVRADRWRAGAVCRAAGGSG